MAAKKFSDLPPAHQGAVLAILPVVLAIVVFYDLVSPLRSQASQLRQKVDALHQENQRGRALENQRAELEKKISQARAELSDLRQIVPDQPADDQFVKMLYQVAQQAGTHLRSLEAQPEARETYYTEMPFKMHMDGTYYGVLNFFTRLAASPRIVNVSGLALGAATASRGGSYKVGAQETVGADCLLTTFYNSPPPAAPAKHGAKGRS